MQHEINHTHDPGARSWLVAANDESGDFPIQNLPLGVFRRKDTTESFRGGVAIGDHIIDLGSLSETHLPNDASRTAIAACACPALNGLLELGPVAWRALRHELFSRLLEHNAPQDRQILKTCMVPMVDAEYSIPVRIGDYTDYYTSLDHATNIMRLFGGKEVAPNFRWLPLAYHGRVSSIDISGSPLHRPVGQVVSAGSSTPRMQPTAKLDYELELGIYIGRGNQRGHAISVDDAESHIFGVGLLNDWSARDIQAWEMNPLGPFLAKNFATTLSPWIVTLEALAPFRSALPRSGAEPRSLPYLDSAQNQRSGGFDIQLEVWIETARQRAALLPASRLSATSFRHQYWTVAQMVAHHTINGCNLRAGDLLGSGTVSGPGKAEAGAMMERALDGADPVRLNTGEERSYVQDGDSIILRGHCVKPGFQRIGFGESRAEVLHARHDQESVPAAE